MLAGMALSTTAATAPPRAGRRAWLGLAVLSLPALLASLELTVTNLALPSIGADLGSSNAQLLWTVDVYAFLLAEPAASAARQSLHAVAATDLSGPGGDSLLAAAQAAFASGFQVAAAASGGLMAATAGLVLVWLRGRRARPAAGRR